MYKLTQNSPVYIDNPPVNRFHKRILVQEVLHLEKHFIEIQDCFEEDIFGTSVDYATLYKLSLEKWNRTADWLLANKKVKHTKLNRNLFTEMYFPQEKETTKTGIIESIRKVIYGTT